MTAPHRNAFSNHRLEAMLRDGWTPQEVRELIASYRELAAELGYAGDGFVRPEQATRHFRRKVLGSAESELRALGIDVVRLLVTHVEAQNDKAQIFEAPSLNQVSEQVRKHRSKSCKEPRVRSAKARARR